MAPPVAAAAPGVQKTLPEMAVKKLPTCVVQAREILADKGIDLTDLSGENLKEVMPSKQFNVLANSYRASMSEDSKPVQDPAKRRREKGLDCPVCHRPTKCNMHRCPEHSCQVRDERPPQGLLAIQRAIGGPKHLNSMAHAEIIIKAEELDSRPHELASLAKENVMQYFFTWSYLEQLTGVKQESKVEATAELKAEEYEEVQRHMVNQQGETTYTTQGPPRRRLLRIPPRKRRELLAKRASKLRGMKTRMDKIHNDLTSSENDVDATLRAKGYPNAMIKWSLEKFSRQKLSCGRTGKRSTTPRPLAPSPTN